MKKYLIKTNYGEMYWKNTLEKIDLIRAMEDQEIIVDMINHLYFDYQINGWTPIKSYDEVIKTPTE